MSSLTRIDVEKYLGAVSDELVARILATGATPDELAQAALELDLGTGEQRQATGPRVEELYQILADELGEENAPEP
jgi:hypothetical protein